MSYEDIESCTLASKQWFVSAALNVIKQYIGFASLPVEIL
jgi:hypothetical protein